MANPEVEKVIIWLLKLKAKTTSTSTSPESKVKEISSETFLAPEHFAQLKQQIDDSSDLFMLFGKIKWAYDSKAHLLIFTMNPSMLHEATTIKLVAQTMKKLELIKERGGHVGDIAGGIEHTRPTVELENYSHIPDATFAHSYAKHPGVVFEISCSQEWKAVEIIAWKLILGSRGYIATVLNIDYPEFNKGNFAKATISLWQAKFSNSGPDGRVTLGVCPKICQEEFRSSAGAVINGDKTLTLGLHDFVPRHIRDGVPNAIISFSYTELAEIAASAAAAHEGKNIVPQPEEDIEFDTTGMPGWLTCLDPEEMARQRQEKLDAQG